MDLASKVLTDEGVVGLAKFVRWAVLITVTLTVAGLGLVYDSYNNSITATANTRSIEIMRTQLAETNRQLQALTREMTALAVQTRTYQEGAIRMDDRQGEEIELNTNRIDSLFRQN